MYTAPLPKKRNFIKETIWIAKYPDSAEEIFYCHKCRNSVFKYRGQVIMSHPGDSGDVMEFPYYAKCKGKTEKDGKCPMEYCVQGIVSKE